MKYRPGSRRKRMKFAPVKLGDAIMLAIAAMRAPSEQNNGNQPI